MSGDSASQNEPPSRESVATPAKVFINYRREGGAAAARLICEELWRRFPPRDVFLDVENIPPGAPFPRELRQRLDDCRLLIVVIHPDWLDLRHKEGPLSGQRRLDDPQDWVRIEIETALRQGKEILPVLFDGAGMPSPDELPESLRECAERNAIELRSGRDYHPDVDRLVQAVGEIIGVEPSPPDGAALRMDNLRPRNKFFTGRAKELQKLAEQLSEPGIAVLSGLGGTGKTDTALEFAHRHWLDYRVVFWMTADSLSAMTSGFARLAELMGSPESQGQDQTEAAKAAQRWLGEHDGWLLVCDNVDDAELLKALRKQLPGRPRGQVLVTTRVSDGVALGVDEVVEIANLDPNDAHTFLLRRSGREDVVGEELAALKNLAEDLGFLALALEQAGGYLRSRKAMTFGEYLGAYHQGNAELRQELLEKMPPEMGDREKRSLAVTWKINFDQVSSESPAAADLLRFFAFLHPDDIPLELIPAFAAGSNDAAASDELTSPTPETAESETGAHLVADLKKNQDDPTAIPELLAPIERYSLIRINTEGRTLSIHRLVQQTLQADMDAATQRAWAERTVLAVNAAFPHIEFANWPLCRQLLPHALAVAEMINRWELETPEASRLLNQTGYFVYEQGQFAEVERLYGSSLAIREKVLGPEHPDVAASLNNLAGLYHGQGKYAEAEPLYQRALAIAESALGPDHPDVAIVLNNLAALYHVQGKYAEAEPLYERSLAIWEKVLGPEHSDVARSLNNLAELFRVQGKYAEAEPLYQRALAIAESALGPDHPDVAIDLNNLAGLYHAQGKYAEAEPLYQRALAIDENAFGPDHPDVAIDLNNLAGLYHNQGKYAEAEPLFRRAVDIDQKTLPPDHPHTALGLENYAFLLRELDRDEEAAELEARAREIREKRGEV